MESRRVFCKKASELKSIDELNLTDDIIELIKKTGCSMVDLVFSARVTTAGLYDSPALDFWNYLLGKWPDEYHFHKWPEELRDYDDKLESYYLETVFAMYDAGYITERCIFADYIDTYYCVSDFDAECSNWFAANTFGKWQEGGVEFFNKNYEEFEGVSKDKKDKILRILKKNVSPAHFSLVEFDFLSWKFFCAPVCRNVVRSYVENGHADWRGRDWDPGFQPDFTDLDCTGEEQHLLYDARRKSQEYLGEEIRTIIFS